MRLVAWNCNMGLHGKLHRLRELQPDLAIIPECASPDILRRKVGLDAPTEMQWIRGKSDHKGLGVFAFNGYTLTPFAGYVDGIRFVLPLIVSGPTTFHLLAVWAFNMSDRIKAADPGPLLRALDCYRDFLTAAPSVVVGDFNNHFVFDRPRRAANHANALAAFHRLGMFSAYHRANAVPAGGEMHPTLYWMRNKDKPYHIDYCFLSESWSASLRSARVGNIAEWLSAGDHMPLVVDVETEKLVRSATPAAAPLAESATLERAIKANLKGMGYGG